MDTDQSRVLMARRTPERPVLSAAIVPMLVAGLGVTWSARPPDEGRPTPAVHHICTRVIIHGGYVVVPCRPHDLTSTELP